MSFVKLFRNNLIKCYLFPSMGIYITHMYICDEAYEYICAVRLSKNNWKIEEFVVAKSIHSHYL
jgi:hypothetical protein